MVNVAYGLLVGISCLVALSAIACSYHYASLQNKLSVVESSYAHSIRLEEFQPSFNTALSLSELGHYAKIDSIGLYMTNGIAITRVGGYSSIAIAHYVTSYTGNS